MENTTKDLILRLLRSRKNQYQDTKHSGRAFAGSYRGAAGVLVCYTFRRGYQPCKCLPEELMEIKLYSLCLKGNVVCIPNQLSPSVFHESEGTGRMWGGLQ